MDYPLFKLEDYFDQWEFKTPYLLCASDAESMSLKELLSMADNECLQLWDELTLGYTENPGRPLLRQEISRLYEGLGSDNILTFAGAGEGIFASMQAMLSPGDHVIGIIPCYQSLLEIPRLIGAEVTALSLEDNVEGWKLNLDQLQSAIRPNTRLIILNFPHNPTGTSIDKESLSEIVEMAEKANAYIFSDEVYRYLEADEKKRLPAIVDIYDKGISLSVTSKAFGLAGLRIGWLAAKDKNFLKKVGNVKHYISLCNSGPSEILALIALRAKERILQRNRELMLTNLRQLNTFFLRYEKLFSWHPPVGGCLAFPKLLAGRNIDQFARSLLDEEGVLLLPGSVYNWPGSYFRIGLGRRNMIQALERMERFVKNHCL